MFVPVIVVGALGQEAHHRMPREILAGGIEIEIAGGRMTVIGSVMPELAQAMVVALRGRR